MDSDEGNKSENMIMTRVLGSEPLLCFSRDGNTAAQFIQLLMALQQQEQRQGWPLLGCLTVQLERCDKCLREYCSPINYRRHTLALHKKDAEQESAKIRKLLAEFWDKISMEKDKEIASFKDVAVQKVSDALTIVVRKVGFSSLPELYLKAGSQILDIIQGGRFPITSEQLFTVLDYASEKTFLCGPASLVQKHVLDGNTEEMVLETKNIIAYTGILLEQKLIEAWHADRDAEAERFCRILVEEEEVARKRRAEDLEKKRQKKLRQREPKEKELQANVSEDVEKTSGNASDSEMSSAEKPVIEHSNEMDSDIQTGLQIDSGYSSNVDDSPFIQACSRKWRRKVLRNPESVEPTSSHESQGSQASKLTIDSQSPKFAISPIKSNLAQTSQATNLTIDSQSQKLTISPINSQAQGPQAKLTIDSQSPKLAISPMNSHLAQSYQASKLTSDSQSQKLAISPIDSLSVQVSQAPELAGFPTYSHGFLGPQLPNSSLAPRRSHDNQWSSQAPVLGNFPSYAHAVQGPRPPNSSLAPRRSDVSQWTRQASNARSHVPQWGSQPPKLVYSGSAQGSQSSRRAFVRNQRNRRDHRTASFSSHNQVSAKGKPELGRDCSEARLQMESTYAPGQTKTHEVVPCEGASQTNSLNDTNPSERQSWKDRVGREAPNELIPVSWADGVEKKQELSLSSTSERVSLADSVEKEQELTLPSTSERVSWADSVEKEQELTLSSTSERVSQADKEAPNVPESPTKEQEADRVPGSDYGSSGLGVDQERPNEQDQSQEHQVMIGALPVSINPEIRSTPFLLGTFNAEAHGTTPVEEPDPFQSGPTVELWTETLVPNGSKELDAGFENMKGNLFENMDWEAAIQIAGAFLHQRWKKAIEGEHVTVVLVAASEDSQRSPYFLSSPTLRQSL